MVSFCEYKPLGKHGRETPEAKEEDLAIVKPNFLSSTALIADDYEILKECSSSVYRIVLQTRNDPGPKERLESMIAKIKADLESIDGEENKVAAPVSQDEIIV